MKEAVQAGWTHFKMKVGASLEDDLRRGRMIRRIIDDPRNYPAGWSCSADIVMPTILDRQDASRT